MKVFKVAESLSILILLIFFMGVSPLKAKPSKVKEMKIRITIGDKVLTATLIDSKPSMEFVAMLPLNLILKDYAGTEKISELPNRLSTNNSPAGYDPSVGDITYYAPWGNLAIFYRDFGYAKGLVKLGSIDDGTEQLAAMKGDFEVLIESIEQP